MFAPRDLGPDEWFDGAGALVLTENEAAAVTFVLRIGALGDDPDRDTLVLANLMLGRYSDRAARALTDAQRAALGRLDVEVDENCGGEQAGDPPP